MAPAIGNTDDDRCPAGYIQNSQIGAECATPITASQRVAGMRARSPAPRAIREAQTTYWIGQSRDEQKRAPALRPIARQIYRLAHDLFANRSHCGGSCAAPRNDGQER